MIPSDATKRMAKTLGVEFVLKKDSIKEILKRAEEAEKKPKENWLKRWWIDDDEICSS